jgi:hypothetical protein
VIQGHFALAHRLFAVDIPEATSRDGSDHDGKGGEAALHSYIHDSGRNQQATDLPESSVVILGGASAN